MTMEWYGQSCFKISTSGAQTTTILTEPFSKETGLNPPRFKPDILILSRQISKDMTDEAVKEGIFLIQNAGEYDLKGVEIRGFSIIDENKNLNIIYTFEIEKIKICHLGDFKQPKIPAELVEEIGEVDILTIPVGGNETIGTEEAVEIINQIEPKIVIPMNYKIAGLKIDIETSEKFLKEMGAEKNEPRERLTIKQKDLPEKTEVVILKA